MSRLLKVLLGIGLLACATACTVDENTVEGKACDLDRPLNQQCISGYVCKCESAARDTCFCVKEGQAAALSAPEEAQSQP